jgi:hypothetical protein
VSALLLRHAEGDPFDSAAGVIGLLGALALLLVIERRYLRTHRHLEDGVNPMGARLVRATAGGTALLAVAAVAVVLAGAG